MTVRLNLFALWLEINIFQFPIVLCFKLRYGRCRKGNVSLVLLQLRRASIQTVCRLFRAKFVIASRCELAANRPFYQYGGHIEFTRFKEYYGMPRGYSLSIHARLYISREKGDHYYIRTRHNDLFFLLQFFSTAFLFALVCEYGAV